MDVKVNKKIIHQPKQSTSYKDIINISTSSREHHIYVFQYPSLHFQNYLFLQWKIIAIDYIK